MGPVSRSFRYVLRRPLRALILGVIFLCMSTALFAAISIRDATNAAADSVMDRFGASFTLQSSFDNPAQPHRGEGFIPHSVIEKIGQLPGVDGRILQSGAVAALDDVKPVSLDQYNEYDEQFAQANGNLVQLEATGDSAKNGKFTAESLRLERGRHLGETDVHKALVHEDFAKLNGLSVGDTFTVSASSFDRANRNRSEARVTLTVAGTFSGTSKVSASTRLELFENIILTDLTTVADLYGVKTSDLLYSSATFVLAPGAKADAVLAEAKRLPLDWKQVDLVRDDRDLISVSSSADGVLRMVSTMVWLTVVFSIVVLTLILFLWLHGRRREAGVMLSLGVGKGSVLAQFVCELALVGIVAFGFSALTGGAVAQGIGDAMTGRASEQAQQDVMRQAGGMLGADAETAVLLKTIGQISVRVDPGHLIWVYAIGLTVIIVAVLLSSIPVLRAQPRDLLARMK